MATHKGVLFKLGVTGSITALQTLSFDFVAIFLRHSL